MALDNARTPRRASGELITITGEEGIGIVNFIFFRYDGGDVGDDRTIHPCFCAFVFSVPDKTNLVDAEINFRDDFGAVFLLGVVEVAKHHIGHYCVLITVDKLLFGSSNNTVDVDGDDLPTLSDKVEGRDGRGGEGASEDCGGFHSRNPFWFMFCVVSHHQARSNQLRTTPFPGFRDFTICRSQLLLPFCDQPFEAVSRFSRLRNDEKIQMFRLNFLLCTGPFGLSRIGDTKSPMLF